MQIQMMYEMNKTYMVVSGEEIYKTEDFITLFNTLPRVDAGLAASIFHFGEVDIKTLKQEMARHGIPARL